MLTQLVAGQNDDKVPMSTALTTIYPEFLNLSTVNKPMLVIPGPR